MKNKIIDCGSYYEVILLNNKSEESGRSKIDKESKYLIGEYRWNMDGNGYASSTINSIRKVVKLHRLIIGAKEGEITDHRNRYRLDNRKDNLRIVSRFINKINSGISKNNTSGFKGVYRSGNKWEASITCHRKHYHLGLFISKQEAINMRKKHEEIHFGKYL